MALVRDSRHAWGGIDGLGRPVSVAWREHRERGYESG